MSAVLDEGGEGRDTPLWLRRHLTGCGFCASEWARLQAVEALLRAKSLVDPPQGFVTEVMARLEAEAAMPRFSLSRPTAADFLLLGIGVLSATIALAVAWLRLGADLVSQLPVLVHGMRIIASVDFPAPSSTLLLPLQVALALAIAVAWFGALVMPRQATTTPIRHRPR